MTDVELPLASEFPEQTYAAWRQRAEQALRGASFDKLTSLTADGLELRPIYAPELDGEPQDERPGAPPFTRGAQAAREGWDIRSQLVTPSLAELNQEALAELNQGATSLELRLDQAGRAGKDPRDSGQGVGVGGAPLYSVAELSQALSGVLLPLAPVALDAGGAFAGAASLMLAYLEEQGEQATARAELGMDPLAAHHGEGLWCAPEDALRQMAALTRLAAQRFPQVSAVTVSTRNYSEAGATDAEELALLLATTVAYVNALLEAGLELPRALAQLSFELTVGTQQLLDIAKLRAARSLLWRVSSASAEALGVPLGELPAPRLRACQALRGVTQRDPWVNLLRGTLSGFSAVVGGATGVTLLPFTAALSHPDGSVSAPSELARRLARNTQLILAEEAHVGQVVDPAGGSHAVEALTSSLAEAAWSRFQAIEAAGGLLAWSRSGALSEALSTARAHRERDVARRKLPITGVSEFPDVNEAPVSLPPVDLEAVRRGAQEHAAAAPEVTLDARDAATWVAAARRGATLAQLRAALGGEPSCAALPRVRLAAPFEALRDAADARARGGSRDKVLLACIGPVAEHTARATFTKNLFEAGGFQAVSTSGLPAEAELLPEVAAEQLKAHGAQLAVLCGSDARYPEQVKSYAQALRQAGAARVYLAGNPKLFPAELTSGVVDAFVFVGVDVLSTLTAAWQALGGAQPAPGGAQAAPGGAQPALGDAQPAPGGAQLVPGGKQ